VHVHAAFLANDAKIRDGLAYVIGGFPDSWTVPALPATSRLTLVVVFELESVPEPDKQHDFAIELRHDSGGEQVATAQVTLAGTFASDTGVPHFRSVVIPFVVDFHHPGPHEICLTECGTPIATVPFAVRVQSTNA
jgi:hypothetical protein